MRVADAAVVFCPMILGQSTPHQSCPFKDRSQIPMQTTTFLPITDTCPIRTIFIILQSCIECDMRSTFMTTRSPLGKQFIHGQSGYANNDETPSHTETETIIRAASISR